jgi:hypothetical protein
MPQHLTFQQLTEQQHMHKINLIKKHCKLKIVSLNKKKILKINNRKSRFENLKEKNF